MFDRPLTRRETLRLTAAGVSAVPFSRWLGPLAAHAAETKQKHKSCILLWMDGGPSQTDTFDPKPDAPAEFRGPYKAIQTAVPGLHIGEGYSKLAKWMDRACVIRGMKTDEAAEHWRGRIYMHTGYRPNFAGLTYDPTKSPRAMDFRNTKGGNPAPPEDGFLPAIYEFLDDDTLKICYPESGFKKDTAPKDRPRPTRFYSDGDRNLWVMKRQPTGASKEPVKP